MMISNQDYGEPCQVHDEQNENMNRLSSFIADNEEWLMSRMLEYAKLRGYSKYTSTLKEAWRLSISGLSESLLTAIKNDESNLELDPDEDYTKDPVASFGILEAKRHRERGVDLSMFLGLMKYYRQSYQDLIQTADFNKDLKNRCRLIVERFFDRVELGFCVKWTGLSENEKTMELQSKNRHITNEKNKYLTIFESIQDPVILLNRENKVDSVNHAWVEMFEGSAVPGAIYYDNEPVEKTIPWLTKELTTVIDHRQVERRFEKEIDTQHGRRCFLVKIKPMLDVSEKFRGTVIILSDITERKQVEETLRESEKLQGVLEMAGAVCHEMNQPLMVISGYSELVSMNISRVDPLYEMISKISEQSYRLGEITRKLTGITTYETKEYLESKIIDIDKAAK